MPRGVVSRVRALRPWRIAFSGRTRRLAPRAGRLSRYRGPGTAGNRVFLASKTPHAARAASFLQPSHRDRGGLRSVREQDVPRRARDVVLRCPGVLNVAIRYGPPVLQYIDCLDSVDTTGDRACWSSRLDGCHQCPDRLGVRSRSGLPVSNGLGRQGPAGTPMPGDVGRLDSAAPRPLKCRTGGSSPTTGRRSWAR